MDTEKGALGRGFLLRLLFGPLGGVCTGGYLPPQAFRYLVATGLLTDGTGNRLAERYSVGFNVPVYAENREVRQSMKRRLVREGIGGETP